MDTDNRAGKSSGIMLCNLGSPKSPSIGDVRQYLAEFLWDPRVVKIWRPLWWLILHIIILNTRPKRSAKLYGKIWTDNGSPLLSISRRQFESLKSRCRETPVEPGMRYGEPSIQSALVNLKEAGVTDFIVLALYPQFSHTTTSSVEDEVCRIIGGFGDGFSYRMIKGYHDDRNYISALARSIRAYWNEHGQAEKLLVSFHGIPQEYADDGDPYPEQCRETARLLADSLSLDDQQWSLAFQSRLGPRQWLQPYTDHTLEKWGKNGIRSVQVVCPGFSADCLETLEEVAMENRSVYLAAGGRDFGYIPCLNDSEPHIDMMLHLLENQLS